jgi:hypothetical protein
MGNENDRPPLARRVPGATRAAPADPERREPPELPEEVRQRIQAVVSAAHAQAAREQAQHEEEARRGQLPPDQPVRRKRSAKAPQRMPDAADGATSPKAMPRPDRTSPQPRRHWSDLDAEFDTAPLPRLTASGAIASPEVSNISAQSTRTAAPDGAVKPGLASKQRDAVRQEQERGTQRKRTARQARIAQRERAAQQQRAARQGQERARQEEQRAAQERTRQEHERAAQERTRQEHERAAQERTRQEHERAAQERTRQEHERAAQERARQEQARNVQESLARQEQKSAAKQERGAQRERAAERKRAAKQERERAAQELIEQKREAQERARQEQERAAEELARQLEELAAKERVRQEQEREDREWAAQKRARLERDREEAEELARREQGTPEQNGAAQPAPRQLTAAVPARAQPPAQPQLTSPAVPAPRVQESPGSWRYRTSALVAAVVVLVGAGSLVIARSLHPSAHGSAHAPTRAADTVTAARNEAAGWVAQQVSLSAVVSCDPVMCLALKAHGVPTYDLLVLEPTAPNPFGSQFVVATAAIREHFGSRLASVYAPAVVASFGSGNARIDIRQIVTDGAAAFWSKLRTDQQERKTFENALLGSLQIVASPSARRQLAAGEVDTRLSSLIEGMASVLPQPVRILAFGDLGPRASPGIPLRSATLAGSMATLQSALAWTRSTAAQPYTPTHAEITQLHGEPVLNIEFAAPSPLGLFSPSNP